MSADEFYAATTTQADAQAESALAARYRAACAACGGAGAPGCACVRDFRRAVVFQRAGIPERYWPLTWADWRGDAAAGGQVRRYIASLAAARASGAGYILHRRRGARGRTGQTMLLALTLKAATAAGYSARYTTMTTFVDDIFRGWDDHEFAERQRAVVERAEFLAIDDLGRESLGSNSEVAQRVGDRLDAMLRARASRNLVTIAATDRTQVEFEEAYRRTAVAVIADSMKPIEISEAAQEPRDPWEGVVA